MDNSEKLFCDFKPTSKEQWIDKATKDLKGANLDKKLAWNNYSQIKIMPFYKEEDIKGLLSNINTKDTQVVNYRRIVVETDVSANSSAIKAIKEGSNGLIFDLKKNISVHNLLKEIDLNEIAISFVLRKNEINLAKDFFALVKEKKIARENLRGYFNIDVIYDYVTKGKIEAKKLDTIAELIKISNNYPQFKAIFISGGVYLNSGANQVQEIAYTLNSLVFLIEEYNKRKIGVGDILESIQLELAIGSEYFVEIAKFRAFNNLLNEVSKKYGIKKHTCNISAKTAIWNKAVVDVNTNMLRATTEIMSAILGGVDGIEVDPYDNEFKKNNTFSSRIAGNIINILKEESYFEKVNNPVDGSYYIEYISNKIAKKALDLFKVIEKKGGFYKCFESQKIQKQIAEIRFEKIKMLSQRRLVVVGANKYPNLMEKVSYEVLSDTKIEKHTPICKYLIPRRATLEIEAIRRRTELYVSKNTRPVVEIISYGDLSMRKARAAFTNDFMGVGGFDVIEEQNHDNIDHAVEKSAKSNSDIVVICSSDSDYNESIIYLVKKFRKINSSKLLLLAGNLPKLANKLSKEGLYGCINIKSDIVSVISRIQDEIMN